MKKTKPIAPVSLESLRLSALVTSLTGTDSLKTGLQQAQEAFRLSRSPSRRSANVNSHDKRFWEAAVSLENITAAESSVEAVEAADEALLLTFAHAALKEG
jgi:hypothetical protein